jgi:hypothetical protein
LHGFCGASTILFSYKLNKKIPFGLIGSGYFFSLGCICLTTMNIQNIFIDAKHVKKEIFCGKVFGNTQRREASHPRNPLVKKFL